MSLDLQIEVTGLTKRFPLSREQRKEQGTAKRHIVAVDGLSFNVTQGEVFGLLGPNGAGKTTTLRLLSTLIAPDSGEAIIHGHSITADPKGVRGCIGFLTSELRLEEIFSPSYLFDFFAGLHHVDPEWASERKKAPVRAVWHRQVFTHEARGTIDGHEADDIPRGGHSPRPCGHHL